MREEIEDMRKERSELKIWEGKLKEKREKMEKYIRDLEEKVGRLEKNRVEGKGETRMTGEEEGNRLKEIEKRIE